jgi:hypothetical protein
MPFKLASKPKSISKKLFSKSCPINIFLNSKKYYLKFCILLISVNSFAAVAELKVSLVNSSDSSSIGAATSSLWLETAQSYSTIVAPSVFNIYRFTHWTNSSYPFESYRDPWGRSLNPISFILYENTTATANYLPATLDSDGDGIPDWYEMEYFGELSGNGTSDTDGDGLTLQQEFSGNTHPLFPNSTQLGGVSYADSALVTVNLAGYPTYTLRSIPSGTVNQTATVPPGTAVTTSNLLQTNFGYWTLDGVRQADEWGVALRQVSFTMNSTDREAVAQFFSGDSDSDGVLDAWEYYHYGTLANSAASDTDGDGISMLAESLAGSSPVFGNSLQAGGVAWADSAMVTVNLANFSRYTLRSEPAGSVDQSAVVADGTVVTTSNMAQAAFGYWAVDGVAQRDAWGVAQRQVSFTVNGSDREAVAYFFNGDTDADALPDGWEMYHLGSLAQGASADLDGDGITLVQEHAAGTSPVFPTSFQAGGVSWADSQMVVANLQIFPVANMPVNGGLFFTNPFTDEAGVFGIEGGSSAPALGDFDGDGDLDLLVGGLNGRLAFFKNAGSPFASSYMGAQLAALPNWPAGPVYAAAGDWDRDGRADLAVGSNDGIVRLYRSVEGTGVAFEWVANVQAGSGAVYPAFLPRAAGLDMLVLDGSTGFVLRYEPGAGIPPYSLASSQNLLGTAITGGTALAVGDTDDDGRLDIVASDANGRIWHFLGQADGSFFLISKVWGGAFDGFRGGLRVSVGDFDGDGDVDILGGGTDGRLVYLRNPVRHLRVDPPLKTVATGEGIAYRSIDNNGTLRWSLSRNASGGRIDELTGAYTAGPNPGVDAILARTGGGKTGVAWVNVIVPGGAVDGIGSALVVAGRRGPNDPVWTATRALANRAYEVLRYRGLQAGDVAFLSHATGDAGVDGLPTRAGIQAALNAATGKPALLLYLVDHGRVAPGGEDGLFLLGKDEQFSGTELDAWLDTYQAANPQTEVTVILECCYADRLAAKVMAGNPAKRAVFSSASANQVAHMAAAGAVSYSSMLWSELSLGKTLEEAHAVAAEAMQRFQAAVGRDPGGIARRGMGMSGVSKVARPAVGSVVPPQTLAGTAVARLWAGGVDGSFPIERVWAVVVPPDYAADGDAPVVDLPEIELMWNASSREYEMEYGGFTEGGPDAPYTVMFYARDIWGQVSLPVVTTVTQTSAVNRVVILSHGNESNPGAAKKAGLVADFAHETALLRRVREENIRYLGEGFANPRVTNLAGAENLRQSIVNWTLPAGKALNALTVYLVGEGSPEGLVCGNGDVVSPAMLKGWLDTLQGATGCAVHVVVDSDYSGRFVPGLASAAYERVVMASCGANQRNPGNSEWASLSRWLWLAIAKGQDLRSSFGFASDLMRLLGPVPFLLDDDGDGVYDRGKDGFKALAAFIGAAFVTADDPPYIGLASPPAVCGLNDTVNIWAANVVMPDGNAPVKVWAELVGPDGAVVQTVEMLWNKVYERYDGFVPGFGAAGRYMALVYAGDPANPRTVSNPAPVQIFAGTTPTGAGAGGSAAGLELPLNGAVFDASIEAGGAAFETRLVAAPGQRVTVEVFGVGSGRNVELSIVGPNGTELAKRDDWGNGFGERIWAWEPTAAGNYTVRVAAAASSGRTDFSVRGFLQQETVDVGSRLAQAILLPTPEKWGLADGTLSLNVTATSGLVPEVQLLEGPASLQNGALTFTERGQVRVRAQQDGSATYAPAPPVWRTIDVVLRTDTYEQWAGKHFGEESTVRGAVDRDDDVDGIPNRLEFLANTDPRDARSRFGVEESGKKPSGFEIRWQGRAGVEYRILATTDFQIWNEVPNTRRLGKNQTEVVTDSDSNGVKKFYRIEILE